MDNLTHTLVGATLGRAGLARRTRFGMAALMIGANLPDLDVLGLPFGFNLGFRRGITHGVVALVLWPFILTGLLWAWGRTRRADSGAPPLRKRELLLLSAIGIASHPLLDWFNSYGMRWLMPFDGTWYYGDVWFIVDPWVIATLGLGLWFSRPRTARAPRPVPARMALGVVALYAVLMGMASVAGRTQAGRVFAASGGVARKIMATPVAGNPLVRQVVIDDGATYHVGSLRPGAPLVLRPENVIESGMQLIDRGAVSADPEGRQFLGWARFPFARIRHEGDTTITMLDDARYADGGRRSFAYTEVRSPARR